MIKPMWRRDSDFKNYNFYEFELFESVLNQIELDVRIIDTLSIFSIPNNFSNILSKNVYDYCFGKQINLKNTERWKRNFLGEIVTFLLEEGRYFQAYVRDVNTNIDKGHFSKTTSESEEKTGRSDTKKVGNVENIQNSDVQGSNQQQGTHELGDTLTVLNNQTTSTIHLASSNEESYSKGNVTETGQSAFSKSEGHSINLGVENGNSLSDQKNIGSVEEENVMSPLEIAREESAFNFRKWMEELFTILDTYFTAGGNEYA